MHEKRSLLPDSCLSVARGLGHSKDSHFPLPKLWTLPPSFQVINIHKKGGGGDSNRLNIGPLKNISMPIQWITKCSQFGISIHDRRMKTHFPGTVTLRYNAVVGRHLLRPPYKRGALWDPIDLFDIVIPRQRYTTFNFNQAWSWTCVTIHFGTYSPHTRVYIISNCVESNKWTKIR